MKATCPGCGKTLTIDEEKLRNKIKPKSSPFKIIIFAIGCMYLFTTMAVLINLNSQVNSIQEKQINQSSNWERFEAFLNNDIEAKKNIADFMQAVSVTFDNYDKTFNVVEEKINHIYEKFNTAAALKLAKPDYSIGWHYTLPVSVILYSQVFETDMTYADQSLSGAYYDTETAPKGTIITINSMKFCNRTASWWINCNSINGIDGRLLRLKGWFNSDAVSEFPLIEYVKK